MFSDCPVRSRIKEVYHGYKYNESKELLLGFKTDTITVGMVEIEKNNNQFEIKPTTPVSTTMAAIIVQPIVKIGYDVIKRLLLKTILVSKCY